MQVAAWALFAWLLPGAAQATESADALLQRCRPIDLHADTTWQVRHHGRDPCGPLLQAGPLHLRQAHFQAQVYALWVHPGEDPWRAVQHAWQGTRDLGRCEGMAQVQAPGSTEVLCSLEGAEVLVGHLERLGPLDLFAVAPTWNRSNAFADAAKGRVLHHGLSRQGRELLDRAGQSGVLIDVSHASDAAARQILARSHLPVIASHSNARAVVDHPRNLPDDLIRAVATSGGVIGLNAHCPFAAGKKRCTTADLAAQVQHVRAIGGDALLALGLDLDGDIDAPTDLQHAGQLANLVEALRRANVPDPAICGLLGENVRRLRDALGKRKP